VGFLKGNHPREKRAWSTAPAPGRLETLLAAVSRAREAD
jgi:hypothetical protein